MVTDEASLKQFRVTQIIAFLMLAVAPIIYLLIALVIPGDPDRAISR